MKDYHTYKNRTYQALGTQPAHDVVSTSNQSIITSSATLFYVLCRLGGYNTFDLFQISFGWQRNAKKTNNNNNNPLIIDLKYNRTSD